MPFDQNHFQGFINTLVGTNAATGAPNQPEGWIVLFGYVHEADPPPVLPAVRTRIRLYLTLQLDEYLIIQVPDIEFEQTISAGPHSIRDGNLLWIQSGARVEYVRVPAPIIQVTQQPGPVSSVQAQASFLGGPIAGGYGLSNLSAQRGSPAGLTVACPGGGLTVACPGGGLTVACPGAGLTVACPGGGLTVACPGGGLTVACPGGGASLGCPGGGVSLGSC